MQPRRNRQAARPPRRGKEKVEVYRAPAWPKWVGGGVAVALVASVAAMALPREEAPTPVAAAADRPSGYDVLEHDLRTLRATLLASDRERVLASLRERTSMLEPAILWVLQQPRHPWFPETARLAAELGIGAAEQVLATTSVEAGSVRRGVAVQALHALQSLGESDLVAFLQDSDRNVVLSALRVVREREQPGDELETVLELLRHPDATIREAAFSALPAALPASAMERLLALVDDGVASRAALRLLGRLPANESLQKVLASELADAVPALQVEILDGLNPFAAGDALRAALWTIVEQTDAPRARIAALHCLERCGDRRDLPWLQDDWSPMARYHAARLSLAAGRRDGLQRLLELTAREGVGEAEEALAAGHARVVLSRLAKLPPHADLQSFTAWIESQPDLDDIQLPPAPRF